MTLVTLLAVNTMINGIKAEMPRVKSAKNPWHHRVVGDVHHNVRRMALPDHLLLLLLPL